MAITVLFFGQLVEITGSPELEIGDNTGNREIIGTKEITGTKELKQILLSRFPGLADIVFNVAVDSVIIDGDIALNAGSTVACLPPFSGG